MEPIRDPYVSTLNWDGWSFPGTGEPPQEGARYMLRLKQSSGGLCPTVTVVEARATWAGPGIGFVNAQGHRLEPYDLIAWRPLTFRDR
ncbi:MAG: hypothetical protein ABIS20_15575 [Thermoanaerobaculia bacterium]